jgi:hemerythrin superfamily protein
MSSDAVTLIKKDHRLLEGLFERLATSMGDRRPLVDEVVARLAAHARAEEREVYPAIADIDPQERAEVDHAFHEHAEAEHLLTKVRNLIESPHFDQALTEFIAAVQHHVREEETEVLPVLEHAVDSATLARLGAAFEQSRIRQLRDAGLAQDSGVADQPADDLTGATRDALYDMAKNANIPGRSRMNKAELVRSLRDHT